MRTFLALVVVGSFGCGGDGGSSRTDAGSDGGVDLETRARACAIVGACLGYTATQCIRLLDVNATPAQIQCALEATVADCTAVRACFGQRISMAPCTPGCADADTLERCVEGLRVETDCGQALEAVGPTCVTNGRADCGGGACAVDNEYTCSGTVSTYCDSGITEVVDCSRQGLECVAAAPRCAGISSGTCAAGTPAACDGDVAVICDGTTSRRQDCSVVGGRTCVADASGVRCALGATCDPAAANRCNGTTLEMCLDGVARAIDCTTIGATTCQLDRCRP